MEDKEIVQLYLDRSEQAIVETSAKYGNYCTSIAMNILNNLQDAEECVNDTYLKTWNSIPPHKPNLFSTFVGKIVRNISFNKYKANHSMKRGGYEVAVILDEISEIVSNSEAVEDEIIANELAKSVNNILLIHTLLVPHNSKSEYKVSRTLLILTSPLEYRGVPFV